MAYKSSETISIPASCPNCESGLVAIHRHGILKSRSWIICPDCDYEISAEDRNRGLLTI